MLGLYCDRALYVQINGILVPRLTPRIDFDSPDFPGVAVPKGEPANYWELLDARIEARIMTLLLIRSILPS